MKLGTKQIEDWGIVTEFVIGDPPIREKLYEVPGRHGKIDATNALTGYPILDNRTIRINIFVKKKTAEEYQAVYDEIYKTCHGEVLKVVFPFDKDYFYKGRWNVSPTQKNLSSGQVVLTASCYPYALKKELTVVDISSLSGEKRDITLHNAGMPTKLYIETNAAITIVRGNKTTTYEGSTAIATPLLIKDEVITVSGAATAKIYYQEGKK